MWYRWEMAMARDKLLISSFTSHCPRTVPDLTGRIFLSAGKAKSLLVTLIASARSSSFWLFDRPVASTHARREQIKRTNEGAVTATPLPHHHTNLHRDRSCVLHASAWFLISIAFGPWIAAAILARSRVSRACATPAGRAWCKPLDVRALQGSRQQAAGLCLCDTPGSTQERSGDGWRGVAAASCCHPRN